MDISPTSGSAAGTTGRAEHAHHRGGGKHAAESGATSASDASPFSAQTITATSSDVPGSVAATDTTNNGVSTSSASSASGSSSSGSDGTSNNDALPSTASAFQSLSSDMQSLLLGVGQDASQAGGSLVSMAGSAAKAYASLG